MAQIAVIGAGYVGLTTAACFASLGHDVICADIDEQRVDTACKQPAELLGVAVEAGLPLEPPSDLAAVLILRGEPRGVELRHAEPPYPSPARREGVR